MTTNDADKYFDLDVTGIFLNTGVSLTSSLTMAGLLGYYRDLKTGELPVIVGIGFIAYVLPKLLVEMNRAWLQHQARKEGFEKGFMVGEKEESAMDKAMDACQRAVYF